MGKPKSMPFQINNLIENSILHITTNSTVPAGQAPRGTYFDIQHYEDTCWYVKNHYAGPNLIHGSSTITITDGLGELLGKKLLNHLTFRIKQSNKSKHFVALTFNLKLNYYSPTGQNINVQDISKNIQNRYYVQCVDLSENGEQIFYSKSNSVFRLDSHLNQIQSWKIPVKFERQNKAASSEIQQALLTLGLPNKPKMDDLKSAFRKSLLKVHPDINRNDPSASDKTRAVVQAYDILTRGDIEHQSSDYETDLGFIKVRFAFDGDSITATQIKTGTEDLYVGCYSGKVYLLRSSGKYKLIYDGNTPVRKIKESGKYLYIVSDQFWDILLNGILVNRIIGSFRLNRILLEETCNAEIINHREIRLYSLGGITFADIEFRDTIADAFMIDKKLKVVTGKKSYIFTIQPPADYKILADNNLFLP